LEENVGRERHFGGDQRCGRFNLSSTQTSYEIWSAENYLR